MGASSKGLVLFSRLANGSIVAMTGVYRRIVGEDQQLLGYAVDFLPESLWTAGFAWAAWKQGIPRKQMITDQKASGAVGMPGRGNRPDRAVSEPIYLMSFSPETKKA